HWLELDKNPGDDYIGLFREPKILYQEIAQKLPFYFDSSEHFLVNDTCYIMTSHTQSLMALAAALNSTLFRCCFKDNFPENAGNTYRAKKAFFDKISIKKPTAGQAALFEKLVPLVQHAKRIGEDTPASFLEDLIDACVMECYFREHMAERDLLFHDDVSRLLGISHTKARSHEEEANGSDLLSSPEFLRAFVASCETSPIRNRLLRIPTASPDLLAIIKAEGKV
ncbi:MAG: TaqI-like C-terminal specificity domain-containing protein, partial [Akkermansiaceae bacterium]